jgi:hypothetical protein
LAAGGLALSTALCSYLQVTILLAALHRRFGRAISELLAATLVKAALATLLCWMVGKGLLEILGDMPPGFGSDILRLSLVIPVCCAMYLVAAKLLRLEVLSLLAKNKGDRHAGDL